MRPAYLIGSSLVVLSLVGIDAGCKSGTGNGGTGGAASSTTASKSSSAATMATTTTGSPTTTTGATMTTTGATMTTGASTGTGVTCGPMMTPKCTCPVGPFPPKASPASNPLQTVYCPFSAKDPATMKTTQCNNQTVAGMAQTCCVTPVGATMMSSCVAHGTACPVAMSKTIDCGAPSDCGTGMKCCGIGTYKANAMYPTCDNFVSMFGGTKCAAACAATGEFEVCGADTDCTGGKKCTTVDASGDHLGTCQ